MTLVDASSWIEFLRGRNSQAGLRVKELLLRGTAAWCDMTLVELWNGAHGHTEKKALQELETELRLFPVNGQVWARARTLARHSREKGLTVNSPDILIAACATAHNLKLEHCDKHFDVLLPLAKSI